MGVGADFWADGTAVDADAGAYSGTDGACADV